MLASGTRLRNIWEHMSLVMIPPGERRLLSLVEGVAMLEPRGTGRETSP